MVNVMQEIQTRAHILGALFYYGPEADETAEIIARFQNGDIVEVLPEIDIAKWQEALDSTNLKTLPQAWQAMFIGPYEFAAPPWGSVYLDRENVVFGESLLDLRAFMLEKALGFNNLHNEAEDHIGLMLLLLAMLCDTEESAVPTFLADHLLPWAPTYFTCLTTANAHPFINLLSEYSATCLSHWQTTLQITPKALKIYWPPLSTEM